jgi:Glycosyltransferase family 87
VDDQLPFAYLLTRLTDPVFALIDRCIGGRAPWANVGPGRSVLLSWIVTRSLMLWIFWYYEGPVINDLNYYFTNLHAASVLGPGYAVPEYPLPVAAVLALPYVLSFGNQLAYQLVFIAMMLMIDAAFTCILFVHQGRRNTAPVTLWLAAGLLIGPMLVTRFDLIPGVLVALSVLWLSSSASRSGAALAIGTGIKLWPILVLPAAAAPRASRVRVIVSSLITAAILIGTTLAVGGWARFISPLRYQSDRGLQIEAPISLPLMFAWAFHPGTWTVFYSGVSKSVEIGGPGENVLLALASILTLLALLIIALYSLRAWRLQYVVTPLTVALISFTSVGLIILSNKVFSPQYLLWLIPTAIVGVALTLGPDDPEAASTSRDLGLQRAATLLLLIALLTQVIYPRAYHWISQLSPLNPVGVTMLAVRDIALAYVMYYFGRRAWRATSSAHQTT